MKHRESGPVELWLLAAALLLGVGCDKNTEAFEEARLDAPAAVGLPPGHPPLLANGGRPPAPKGGATRGGIGEKPTAESSEFPLRLEGPNSLAEMRRDAGKLENEALVGYFEEGFRACFTENQSKRDYRQAAQAFQALLAVRPEFAPAWRGLGYARFNTGFDVGGAMEAYQKAVDLDPDYGEAHYAIAFMWVMSDVERGRVHFERAMALGISDDRNLGSRFFNGSGG